MKTVLFRLIRKVQNENQNVYYPSRWILIFAFSSYIIFAAYQERGFDASSKTYVEKNLPAIINNWSEAELVKRASPQLLKIIKEKPGQLDQLFQKLSTLGAMQSFGDVKGESNINYSMQNGKMTTAYYIASAKFAHGEAKVAVRLIQSAGQWQFLLFNVKSPLFLSKKG